MYKDYEVKLRELIRVCGDAQTVSKLVRGFSSVTKSLSSSLQ